MSVRLTFPVVMTESLELRKMSKAELEQLIKANGGKIYQTNTAAENTLCIADRSKLWTTWTEQQAF